MPAILGRFSFDRPLASYTKVQSVYGHAIWNRRFQLQSPRVRSLRYLDLGCGPNIHQEFINIDYLWRPGIDLCWDVTRGIPLGEASMHGVFTEHALEHFPTFGREENFGGVPAGDAAGRYTQDRGARRGTLPHRFTGVSTPMIRVPCFPTKAL